MLANLAPHKGQETALHTLAELRRQGRKVQCWLAGVDRSGDESYATKLRHLTADLGLSSDVSFLGFRQDTPELLRAADVVLLPSTNEGLPLVILEAQAAGVPVIAAPTAGIPEIIEDGKTGFLVEADDAVGYAARIELLMGQPDTYGSIVRDAMQRCRSDYSWDAFQRRMDELYCELLAG